MKRLLTVLLLLGAVLLLAGCGSAFEKEYVSVTDYVPPAQEQTSGGERFTVRNFIGLRNAIRNIVYAGNKGNVLLTMVAGKILYEEGKYSIGEDPGTIIRECASIRKKLMDQVQ